MATATSAPANQPPIADAGSDQTVEDSDGDGFETVTLDASGSSDPDGSIISYEWREDGTLLASGGASVAAVSLGRTKPLLAATDSSAVSWLLTESLLGDGPDFMVEGNQPQQQGFVPPGFGGPLDSAGDVNGDGFDDIIVGAPGWNGGGSHEGAAFVFLGSASGIVGTNPATANAHIESNQPFAQLGTVSGAGDVNGDGFDDIIVGAHFYDSLLPGTDLQVDGAAFVFHGGPQGITGTDPTTADATILANQLSSDLGAWVSGAGDVNGDGFDDILVGVPGHGTPFPSNIPPNQRSGEHGAALLFYGSPAGITGTGFDDADAVLLSYEDTGQPEPPIYGKISSGVGAGDVNGDGFDDIVLSGTEIALFLGSASGIPTGNLTTADARVQPSSSAATPLVAAAGDVNGDGFDDVLGSSPFQDLEPGSTREEGVAYILLGGPSGIAATDTSQAHAMFTGNMLAEWVGISISGAGDIDNDGYDDVLIGALSYPGGLDSEGATYLFRGGPQGITAQSLLDADARLDVRQSLAIRYQNILAVNVEGAGDVNGDGFDDVLVGKGYYDNGENNEGAAFGFLGHAWPANPNQPPVADAGPDQLFVDLDNSGTAPVSLNGQGFDPDGTIISYAWYKDFGETLLGTTAQLQTELPHMGDQELVLVVTDDQGVSRGDPVTVRVEPPQVDRIYFDLFNSLNGWTTNGDVSLADAGALTPPQARLGAGGASMRRSLALPAGTTGVQLRFWAMADQFAAEDEVRVNVSADGGPFRNVLTLTRADSDGQFRFYGGSGAVLSLSWYPATASNVVVEFESATSSGQFFVDELTVDALIAPQGANAPPVADAGPDQTLTDSNGDGLEPVVLDGSASFDPDGAVVSYQWHEGETLLGETASLATDLAVGEHVLTLTVTDEEGLAATDTVVVTVMPSAPEPDSQITLTLPVGEHTIELTVTDDDGATATDTVVVTVNGAAPANEPPAADAGSDQTVTDNDGDGTQSVTLDGSGSSDADGTITGYVWREAGEVLATGANPTVALATGVHTIQLTVTDDDGATAVDEVSITVEAAAEPEAALSISAPSSVERGDRLNVSMTVVNSGAATLQGVSLTFDWSPSRSLKDLSDPSTVSLGDIAPGQSATFTWRVRADRRGTVTFTGTATMNGATLATSSRSMQILR